MNKLSLLLTSLVFSSAITANAQSDLQFDVYNADDKSFNVKEPAIKSPLLSLFRKKYQSRHHFEVM